MPTTNFDRRKENLINTIIEGVTEEAELTRLQTLLDKLMTKRAVRLQKLKLKEKVDMYPPSQRVPFDTAMQSENNITHEEAIEELQKLIQTWK